MDDEKGYDYDSHSWTEPTGASTGDARENDPTDAGFTEEADRLFRSHYQHANRMADRSYEQVRPAYQLGYAAATKQASRGRAFDEIEKDLEHGWLSVRVAGGDWMSVREFARTAFDNARQGRISFTTPIGTTPSHDRPSFADPLPDAMDPTAPGSPEEELGN
jgi:hypothetical protein